jgi:aspartokinase/homoserine dehydrogenase 1
MKVMKFGGTSVSSAKNILKVKEIVEAVNEPVIVVVSAMGGITDQLLLTSKLATQGDYSYEKEYNQIVSRHIETVENVIADPTIRNYVLKQVLTLLDELGNILKGVFLVRDLSQNT